MRSLRFFGPYLLAITCCICAFSAESGWSVRASFYENATWKKIWILYIDSTGDAHLKFTKNPIKEPDGIERNRKLAVQEKSMILALFERVEKQGLEDIFSDDAIIDGPVFFIEFVIDGKVIESASMNTGSPDQSKEREDFIKAWSILARVFPTDAPFPKTMNTKIRTSRLWQLVPAPQVPIISA